VLLICFSVIPFFQDGNKEPLWALILQNLKRLPAMLIAAYTFNEYLMPKFYATKRYLPFALFSLMLFYVCSGLDRVVNVYVYEPLFREPPFDQEPLYQIFTDIPFLITAYLSPVLLASFSMTFERVVRQKQVAENKNIELQRDRNKAELNALKSQLHPHFLFNTLNNLYALTVQKSDKAPETVATLSEMLDYILYQCNDKLVSLKKEINLVENYIALEKLRYGDEITVCSQYAFAKADTQIAPLLLLSIVENAFKHGASGSTEIPEIHIDIKEEGTTLFIVVKNTKNSTQQEDTTGYSKGIGVKNIKQQLDLLYTDYTYEVTNENGWYKVDLRINTDLVK